MSRIFDVVLRAVKTVASFFKVQCEHIMRDVMGCEMCMYVYFKFPGVCFFHELAELDDT